MRRFELVLATEDDARREWNRICFVGKALQDREKAGERLADHEASFLRQALRTFQGGSKEFTSAFLDRENRRRTEEYESELKRRQSRWDQLVPKRYANCTLDNFVVEHPGQAEALAKIRAFADQLDRHVRDGINIVFHGPAGVGKDHVMFGLLRIAILEAAPRVGAVHWVGTEMGRVARQTKAGSSGRVKTAVDPFEGRVTDVDILAISDPVLAGEKLQFFELQLCHNLVERAYSYRSPVWVTINATKRAELDEMLTRPVADRILDGAFVVHFNWPSFRKKGEF